MTCRHPEIVPAGDGFGRCTTCGDDTFPITAEAAGAHPCCGGFDPDRHRPECDELAKADELANAVEDGNETRIHRALTAYNRARGRWG